MTTELKHTYFFTGILCILACMASPGRSQPRSRDSLTAKQQKPANQIVWLTTAQAPDINEFNIWGGYAFDSFRLWGKTPGATLSLLGIRYNRKFLKIYNCTLEYTLAMSLHARYTYPEFTSEHQKNSITGVGFSPFGFQFNFLNSQRLQPFLRTSGGFMFLSQPFPDSRGRKINFTFGAGGGLEYLFASHASFSLGYRFFHLSNGETGEVNPGIDSSFFYAGITFF